MEMIDGTYIIYLDTRPVLHVGTRLPLRIPASKPNLATAIALEWDNLDSTQQALRAHFIPLTSIVARAIDISAQDTSTRESSTTTTTTEISNLRSEIITSLLRYLDTDTLLCWAPPTSSDHPEKNLPSLRDLQIRIAKPIIAYLTQYIWPGVDLVPILDDAGCILPVPQPEETRAVIRGWLAGLPAWELAGLERAVLAGKSLCVGVRLVVEWSEVLRGRVEGEREGEGDEERDGDRGKKNGSRQRFGIEQAAEACSSEVRWQTGRWGEVEDTHDVEKEDLRRQFGSVVLLVGGRS
jgi:ATP synthase F1 complex assembly factor 2